MKIACVAGRSGGHILPVLTLARMKHQCTDKILFFSTHYQLDRNLLSHDDIDHVPLKLDNIPYKKWWKIPFFIVQLILSFFYALIRLHAYKPEKIITSGGYIALPVILAARMLRISVDMYEFNAIPGQATKILSYFATTCLVSFVTAQRYFPPNKIGLVSYPVRFKERMTPAQARALLQIPLESFVITIFGGSQGARQLNEQSQLLIHQFKTHEKSVFILHQTGSADVEQVKNYYEVTHTPAIVESFVEDPSIWYAAADVIICRAGAGSIFEALWAEKRTILVPLRGLANDHQYHNAREIMQQYPALFTIFDEKKMVVKAG
jgi:UDP-N-acetylglucosamine--N-acetylmuramyl-(pentapeptide) pyrophosphoryl-undecaprenol N-acetylglucosamine transferase